MRFFVLIISIFIVGVLGGCTAHMEELPLAAVPRAAAPDTEIAAAMKLIEKAPDSAIGYNQLAVIYIKRARYAGDFQLNAQAEKAVNKALEISPNDETARKLQASLNLTYHRFADALELGKKLQNDFPKDAFVYGILTDANVELGNYPDAVAAAQKMVDLRPNSNSYARVAHLRSLHGDHPGAVEMYKMAARTADPQDEEAQSWCLVQVGDEFWKNGKFKEAEAVYDEALQQFPNYHLAMEGKGRVRASQNDLAGAEKFLTEVQARVPSTKVIVELAQVYTLQGEAAKAASQFDLLEAVDQKLGSVGDQKDLALSWADRDVKLDEALTIADREYRSRKDIYTADVLAWCLYKKGRHVEAKAAITEAMRLKTGDARIMYHAAMIEKALGNKKASSTLLYTALKLNPGFDLVQAGIARNLIAGT